jgi:hypothetical protein
MHFCTAKIQLAGDLRNVVHREQDRPISWPEAEILRYIHGEEAVLDVKPFVSVKQTAKQEKERLGLIYGHSVVDDIFPGKNPQMDLDAPGAKVPEKVDNWRNPIDQEPAGYDVPPEQRAKPAAQ